MITKILNFVTNHAISKLNKSFFCLSLQVYCLRFILFILTMANFETSESQTILLFFVWLVSLLKPAETIICQWAILEKGLISSIVSFKARNLIILIISTSTFTKRQGSSAKLSCTRSSTVRRLIVSHIIQMLICKVIFVCLNETEEGSL